MVILVWLEVVKCLILLGFIEVGIEVILVYFGCFLIDLIFKVEVRMEQICRFWLPAICLKM